MHGHGERTTDGSGCERSSSAAPCERARRQRRIPVGQASGPFLQRLGYATVAQSASSINAALRRSQSSISAIATNLKCPRRTQRSSGTMCLSKKSRLHPSDFASSPGVNGNRAGDAALLA
jgi:hypothetical protein